MGRNYTGAAFSATRDGMKKDDAFCQCSPAPQYNKGGEFIIREIFKSGCHGYKFPGLYRMTIEATRQSGKAIASEILSHRLQRASRQPCFVMGGKQM